MIVLFRLTCLLGGFGSRARRGFGSVKVTKIDIDGKLEEIQIPNKITHIHRLLEVVNQGNFKIMNETCIQSFFKTGKEKYPYIKKIEISSITDIKGFPKKVGQASHNTKKENPKDYQTSLGSGGRFASPIIVSCLDEKKAVISTLNTVSNSFSKVNTSLQDSFKTKILNK